jgi:hypothetical protein
VHDMEYAWNDFVERLLELKESWKEFQKERLAVSRSEELDTTQGQKVFGLATTKSKFDVALPRILEFARRSGGIETLLIEESEDDNAR